jgi:hypothetical protein
MPEPNIDKIVKAQMQIPKVFLGTGFMLVVLGILFIGVAILVLVLQQSNSLIFLIPAFLCLFLSIIPFSIYRYSHVRLTRLSKYGQIVVAQFSDIVKTDSDEGLFYYIVVAKWYNIHDDQTYSFNSSGLSFEPKAIENLQNFPIQVVIDPQNPKNYIMDEQPLKEWLNSNR